MAIIWLGPRNELYLIKTLFKLGEKKNHLSYNRQFSSKKEYEYHKIDPWILTFEYLIRLISNPMLFIFLSADNCVEYYASLLQFDICKVFDALNKNIY